MDRFFAIIKDRLVGFAYWLLNVCHHNVPIDKISRSYSIDTTTTPIAQQDIRYKVELTKLVNHCKPYIETDVKRHPNGTKDIKLTIKVAVPDKITDPALEGFKNLSKI